MIQLGMLVLQRCCVGCLVRCHHFDCGKQGLVDLFQCAIAPIGALGALEYSSVWCGRELSAEEEVSDSLSDPHNFF